ncbi:MAG TPA: multifunctional oxoglutarate decarboxylase/oxoglutarate dehydrogenase thiamine pyrophosphate-binding subunit/dihydrolipoyllysine-residue succinyltransferase subunit [Candidatus Kapabacteria bacterium]|nr:multifunctional oxoglutarate decarboxylase/oxoglutarate dehydrogenase thiamine pyrophosphate-binding subunit/dihydrolipoyllysine-residue succinyltransferase subunit [Candidatus Kapabacteria bacterium]
MSNNNNSKVAEQLAEEFGPNASYVETLLDRYLSSPELVDESWSNYFAELLGPPATNGKTVVQSAEEKSILKGPISPMGPISPSPLSANTPAELLRGGAKKIVENMEQSLSVPTATSVRLVPVKLLDENRRVINEHLALQNRGKVSYTHIVAWAILRAMDNFPQMNDGYILTKDGPARIARLEINFGVAVDIQRKDGARTLLVPNIKSVNKKSFAEFLHSYDDIVARARSGKLEIPDFEGTTISLTNPGTIGTVGSVPRLMAGQSMIVATGAIEYPAEYQAMSPEALSQLGVSKVVQISNTYDHRVIQGAESGAMLARVHELLLGKDEFYERIFGDLEIPVRPFHWALDTNPALLPLEARERLQMKKQAGVLDMINAYRVRGHLIADLDPLHAVKVSYNAELDIETYGLTIWDLDREFDTGTLVVSGPPTLRKILEALRRAYCGTVGVEYRHIQSREEKLWIQKRVEGPLEVVPPDIRKHILWKLISAEQFEKFLHTNYLGQKRFSIEGSETLVPLLDELVERAVEHGAEDITFGMTHRGRLNVIANVIGHFCERIFAGFEGTVHPNFPADESDVRYHLGASGSRETQGKTIPLTLANNPSHLESIDPVIEGMVRAKQDALAPLADAERWEKILPVLIHGDAAFAGQGIVMETLNLSNLHGYRVGGTVHIVVNNQIGFTTSPEQGRSTVYSTDIARLTQSPIFHVNGDDPDAAYQTLLIVLDYRTKFHKDVVIDLIGFRRLGHNESDEPSYTQPLMYSRVKTHPGVRDIYAKRLVKDGILSEDEVNALIEERKHRYSGALERAKQVAASQKKLDSVPPRREERDGSLVMETDIERSLIESITQQITIVPPEFHLNPKMVSQLGRRMKMGEGSVPADWAFGEALAFGSLVMEGTHVRLSGQDSGRGTFSQRHAVRYDIETGAAWAPLAHLAGARGMFEVLDSSLSELGVLGFEYGYSVIAQNDLVIWEAQFGDFANGGQVIIDQYISAGEEKWGQQSRLTMLLPHGYEGQGPEHSSGRLERYLQLCAENNLQVTNPTTPAQYFHLLRRQAKQNEKVPLIVMTPKSLLRLHAAASSIEDFTKGGFLPVIPDTLTNRTGNGRIVLCSGKVYYDLLEGRGENKNVALIRVEQLYPFPATALKQIIGSYPGACEIIWCQEEPENMGAWTFMWPRLESLGLKLPIRYVGRRASASPATGFYAVHELEQKKLVEEAVRTA